jgi:hypothetical protein
MTPCTRHTKWTGLYIVTLLLFAGTVSAGEGPQFMIKINDVILLSDHDIELYDWRNHKIKVTPVAKARIDSCWPKYFTDEWPPNNVDQIAGPTRFSVIANGEVVYSGNVHYRNSSCLHRGPLLLWPFFTAGNSQIDIWQYHGVDSRSDIRVQCVLMKLGVLIP